jgi:hypothetical protein
MNISTTLSNLTSTCFFIPFHLLIYFLSSPAPLLFTFVTLFFSSDMYLNLIVDIKAKEKNFYSWNTRKIINFEIMLQRKFSITYRG